MAPPGGDAHPAADGRAAQEGLPVAEDLGPGVPHRPAADARALALEGQPLFHRQQDRADAEQADHRDQEVEALEQFRQAVGHAQLAGDGVHAHGGQGEAQHHRGQGLGRRLLAHADEAGEGEPLHGEELGRIELQRELRQQRRQEGDQAHREQRADKAAGERRRQRLRRLALLRHRVSSFSGNKKAAAAAFVHSNVGRPAEAVNSVQVVVGFRLT